jgi:hypothetical protein
MANCASLALSAAWKGTTFSDLGIPHSDRVHRIVKLRLFHGQILSCWSDWWREVVAVGMFHTVLACKMILYVFVHIVAPDNWRHIVHTAKDVVCAHPGLPVVPTTSAAKAALVCRA